jgi:hypothetical protein
MGITEEDHRKLQRKYLVSRSKFELGTFHIQIRSITTSSDIHGKAAFLYDEQKYGT